MLAVVSPYSVGGLGKDIVVDEFEVWLCSCRSLDSKDDAVCFAYSE